jgi:predicted PurR-regulated permease PerM
MTLRNQVLVWVGFFLVIILLLWVFSSILLPFVVGLALAYLLNPMVNVLVRIGIRRAIASALVLILVLAIIVGLLLMLVPLVTQQVLGLVSGLPRYVSDLQLLVQGLAPQLTEWLGPEQAAQVEESLSDLLGRAVALAGGFTAQLAQSGLTVLNTIAVLFITPVVAFYLLLDWEGMIKRADDLLPRQYREEIRGVVAQIDRSMAGVLRGVGGVVLVLSVFYASALWMVGLDFGIAIGVIGGVMSFIPYVGFLLGFTLSLTVAAVQFWPEEWLRFAIVVVIYVVGQFLEGNILYPKLVGQSININPVWLMFALFAFGLLFGFVGLLLAVPLAAIVGVLTRYALRKYQASSLYRGDAVVLERPPSPPARSAGAVAKRRTPRG